MNEYIVFWERDANDQWSLSDTPVSAAKRVDGIVTIYGDKRFHDSYINFSKTETWKRYLNDTDTPLAAWLCASPYGTGRTLQGKNAANQFDEIVAKLDFKPVSFGKKMKFSDMKVVVDET